MGEQPQRVGGMRLDDFIGREAATKLALEGGQEGNYGYRRVRRPGENPQAVSLFEGPALTVGSLETLREEMGEEGAQEFLVLHSLTQSVRAKATRRLHGL